MGWAWWGGGRYWGWDIGRSSGRTADAEQLQRPRATYILLISRVTGVHFVYVHLSEFGVRVILNQISLRFSWAIYNVGITLFSLALVRWAK